MSSALPQKGVPLQWALPTNQPGIINPGVPFPGRTLHFIRRACEEFGKPRLTWLRARIRKGKPKETVSPEGPSSQRGTSTYLNPLIDHLQTLGPGNASVGIASPRHAAMPRGPSLRPALRALEAEAPCSSLERRKDLEPTRHL